MHAERVIRISKAEPLRHVAVQVPPDARDIAEPVAYAVDEMGAEPAEHPAAADGRSGRGSAGTPRKSQVQGGGNMARLADVALIDELARKGPLRREPELMSNHVRQASITGHRQEFFSLSGIRRERLLAHHVLTGLKSSLGHLIVQAGSGDNADGVDVRMCNQFVVVRKRVGNAELLRGILSPFLAG